MFLRLYSVRAVAQFGIGFQSGDGNIDNLCCTRRISKVTFDETVDELIALLELPGRVEPLSLFLGRCVSTLPYRYDVWTSRNCIQSNNPHLDDGWLWYFSSVSSCARCWFDLVRRQSHILGL
jgi:hypothetical protein